MKKMNRFSFGARRSVRATTLLELLVVISVIVLLLSLIGVVAQRARAASRMSRTKALIARIHVAMDIYQAAWRTYPTDDPNNPQDVWPNTGGPNFYLDPKGVELDRRWLTDRDPTWEDYNQDDLDPNDDTYLVDAWRGRIRYRKTSRHSILIWSKGPDGIDDIGNNVFDRNGDDVSSVFMDFQTKTSAKK